MYEERLLWPAYPSNFSLCEINMATQSQKRWKRMFVTNTSPQSGESVDFESKKGLPLEGKWLKAIIFRGSERKIYSTILCIGFSFFCRSTTVARNV